MNAIRRAVFFLALVGLCIGHASPLAAATTLSVVRTQLSVDGTACDAWLDWHGGEAVGEVAVENAAAGAAPKKHIRNFYYAPVSVTLRQPLAAPLITLINDFLGNRATPHTIAIAELDLSGKVSPSSIEVGSATLTEVNFCGLDAASKVHAEVTLVFEGIVRASPAVGTTPARSTGPTKNVYASRFSLRLAGTSPAVVGAISAFSAKRSLSAEPVGRARAADPSPLVLSNLVVTLSETQAATWKAWADDFYINGNRADSDEKSATLDLLEPLGHIVEFSFQFSHVGIVRLSRVPEPRGLQPGLKLEAELYYEALALGAAAPGASTPAAPATPPGPTSPTAPAKEPVTPATTVPASPAATVDPADAGGHVPADLPRIGSIV